MRLPILLFSLLLAGTSVQARPNVLFIVCDDLNNHVSPAGYAPIQTPALEALAADAMTFERAYCQYPVCGPSRASFLSGLYPESTGVLDNRSEITEVRPGTISMPAFFRENDYWTGATGKIFHKAGTNPAEAWDEVYRYSNDELPVVAEAREAFEKEYGSVEDRKNRQAWRAVMKEAQAHLMAQDMPGYGPSGLTDEQHSDGKNAAQVSTWITEEAWGDKPFFMAVGIHKPHVPFLAPQAYFDMYPVENLEYTLDPADLWDGLPGMAKVKRYEQFGFELGKENEELRREYMQAYHACISFIDVQIGKVLTALDETGLKDETIVVFTSDHGYQLGEHFMWGKVTLFEVCARVPMIIRVPGMTEPGSRSEGLVELIDLFPTLADLTGLKAPDYLQGKSLRSALSGDSSADKDVAYTMVMRGEKMGHAIRTKDWRYGLWPDGEELYHLGRDPHERSNLAGNPEYEPQLNEMAALLKARRELASSLAPDSE